MSFIASHAPTKRAAAFKKPLKPPVLALVVIAVHQQITWLPTWRQVVLVPDLLSVQMTWLPTCVQVVVATAPVTCAKNSVTAKIAVLFMAIFPFIEPMGTVSLGPDCGITLKKITLSLFNDTTITQSPPVKRTQKPRLAVLFFGSR